MPENTKSNALKAIVVVCIALMGTLVAAEVGIRLVEKAGLYPELFKLLGNARPPLDRKDGPGMYYAHPYSAYALKPGYTRSGFERINSLGFRGEDISLEKPDDVYRIVAVGGSTTFAVYLPWNQSYPYLLQEELRRRFNDDRIEVINAGLTGSTAAESFHRMATQILPLDPDMVVIYHAFNDLFPRMFNDYSEDYYHFRRNDPNNPPGMTRSYLYRLALRALSPGFFHENNNQQQQVWKIENLPATDTERSINFINSSNHAFKFHMDNIVKLIKANGGEAVLATFAMNSRTYNWTEHIPPYLWEVGIAENNEAIKEIAMENDVPVVPFAEAPFPEASKRFQVKLFPDSIHMAPEGNQLKAEIFADVIAPIIAKQLGVPVPEPSRYKTVPLSLTEESPLNAAPQAQ